MSGLVCERYWDVSGFRVQVRLATVSQQSKVESSVGAGVRKRATILRIEETTHSLVCLLTSQLFLEWVNRQVCELCRGHAQPSCLGVNECECVQLTTAALPLAAKCWSGQITIFNAIHSTRARAFRSLKLSALIRPVLAPPPGMSSF